MRPLSSLTQPCIFLLDKNSFPEKFFVTYGTPRSASGHLVFLILSMLLVWHYTTQWSEDTAPELLTRRYATQWLPGDLLQVLQI